MAPKFTFLLPAYKKKYLREALLSIREQTYNNFNVIISDDCSPEDLYSVVEPFLVDKRFSYYRNQKNIGGQSLTKHWNILLDKCESEYVIIASDDDLYHCDFLSSVNSLVERYPMCNLFRSRVKRIVDGELKEYDPLSEEYMSQLRFIFETYMYKHIHCIGNYVFKRNALIDVGRFYDYPLAWFSDDRSVIELSRSGVASTFEILFTMRNSSINISSEMNCSAISASAKTSACKQFLIWFMSYVKTIEMDGSLYEKNMLDKSVESTRDYVYKLLMCYIEKLPLRDYIDTHKFLYFNWFILKNPNKLLLITKWIYLHKIKYGSNKI